MNKYGRWLDSMKNKYSFYANCRRQKRTDDYPWDDLGKNKFSLSEMIKYNMMIFPIFRRFFARDTAIKEFSNNSSFLWRTRNLFCDDISKILFDEALLMRMLGHGRYFAAVEHCDDILSIEGESSVDDDVVPEKSNNIALKLFSARLISNDAQFKFIGTTQFVSDTNRYGQYFLRRNGFVVEPQKDDVVFDCGSCLGDTTMLFAAAVGGGGQVHAFDPIPLHSRILERQVNLNKNFAGIIFNNCVGVGGSTKILDQSEIDDSLYVSPGGVGKRMVSIERIDDYVIDNNVKRLNYLKMDIEGFELEAIMGAATTIKRFRPKLAICVYHRSSDFWKIPELIREIDDGYDFAFAHHSPLIWESMVYCVPKAL